MIKLFTIGNISNISAYVPTYYSLAAVCAQNGLPEMREKTLLAHLECSAKLQKNPHNFWVEDWAKRRGGAYSETYVQMSNLY